VSAELALARLEKQVLGVARVARFLDAVDELRRMLAREDPRLREAVLRLVAPSIGRDLAAAVGAAFDVGVRDAEKMIGEGRVPGVPETPPKPLIVAAKASEKTIAEEIANARKLARAGADPATALAPVLKAANALERDVATLVNHAGNAGTTAVADKVGLSTVWIAETNACVECLAYSGRVAKPGKSFPGGLTYGAKSYNPTAVESPPRHPHCRCTVEPLVAPEYAQALRREADRSVLRGFSLESEPMRVRIDAADRLIRSGVDAPKTVIAFARRAVERGEFPTRGRP
jgi:hypothetical protein